MSSSSKPAKEKQRFNYIDQFRGLVGVLMLLGHSSYYFNGIWNHLDPFDPLFPSRAQFILRYIGYLCAPGFLMMSGAMVWWSFQQHTKKDMSPMKARWHLIQRGLFLVLVQVTWVNSSWGGFKEFQPGHLGIIACIGLSMVLLTVFINTQWYIRLLVAIAMLIIHPFLLQITYDPKVVWQEVVMQTFVDAGDFNKYPVLPWFALMSLGSVMATAWIKIWKTDKQRILYGALIAAGAILLAIGVRMGRGFGNILPFSDFGTYTFFIDQKYPPSLFHNLWFFWMGGGRSYLIYRRGQISPAIALLPQYSRQGAAVLLCHAPGHTGRFYQTVRPVLPRRRCLGIAARTGNHDGHHVAPLQMVLQGEAYQQELLYQVDII